MEGLAFWTAATVAAVLVGMAKGGLPMVGLLSVPILSLVIPPVAAAGLLLPIYVVSDLFGLYAYRREFDARVLAIFVPGMTLGVGAGWATASVTPEWLVTGLVGLIGAGFALVQILRRGEPPPRPARVGPGLAWGAVAGFTSFVSHAGAPPFQIYTLPLRLGKAVFAGTATIAFAYVNAIKLVPYWALGQLNPGSLGVAAILAVPASAAVWLGYRLVRRLPERLFFRLITWTLLAVSLRLVWEGVEGAFG